MSKNKTLTELFEEQVLKTPDNTALVFGDQKLTYKELNERSNQLANFLKAKGVQTETLVPICIDRSLEMLIGIIGILKAGAAYVPVDPEYPEERIRYMLEDTAAAVVITNKENRLKLPVSENINIIEIDGDLPEISRQPKKNIKVKIKPNNLAYAIYTSGSTGKPKGVMNEHGGVVNRLNWAQDYFRLTSDDSVLQKTTFCFDVSVWELLWPLLAGARLVIAKPGGHKDTGYLKSIIDEEKITMMHFVPSMLEIFLSELETGECTGLKKVLCSGEALKPSHVEQFIKKLPDAELHNLYGPTEAAIDVTCWSLKDKSESIKTVPIGRPVANTKNLHS
ncbi:MAG: AMP-binding protein [Ignavibacteria bacterium]|nr:AMP-binding protein [Ignavibacteria bacterium]